jgi:hypothetical protein
MLFAHGAFEFAQVILEFVFVIRRLAAIHELGEF